MTVMFNAEDHAYWIDEQPVPSVTQVLSILNDWSGVPPATLEAAADFGRNAHEACHLDNLGLLDEAALDPALTPYLAGWRKFLADSGAVVIDSELIVASTVFRYAGKLDTVVEWRDARCLIDVKTGAVPRTVGPQTAAYARAYNEPGYRQIRRRYCVQLLPNDYRTTHLKDPADWPLFMSCLNVWRFRNAA